MRLTLACCAAALLTAACGGSGSSPANFTADANQICRNLADQERANGTQQILTGPIDDAVNKLEALTPHPYQKHDFLEMMAAFKAADIYFKQHIVQITVLSKKLQQNPNDQNLHLQLVQLIQPVELQLRDAAKHASTLGLTQCVTGFGGTG